MNLKISIWCNQVSSRVQIVPIMPTDNPVNHTSFFLINGEWWSKKTGLLMPDELRNECTPEEWLYKMRDLCVDEVEKFVGQSSQDIVNGECVYYFDSKDAAIGFANSIANECKTVLMK